MFLVTFIVNTLSQPAALVNNCINEPVVEYVSLFILTDPQIVVSIVAEEGLQPSISKTYAEPAPDLVCPPVTFSDSKYAPTTTDVEEIPTEYAK